MRLKNTPQPVDPGLPLEAPSMLLERSSSKGQPMSKEWSLYLNGGWGYVKMIKDRNISRGHKSTGLEERIKVS